MSLNTSLNYELRQLKQQETTLLKLLVDHLATCSAPGTVLAALSPALETATHGADVSGETVVSAAAAAGSVQIL